MPPYNFKIPLLFPDIQSKICVYSIDNTDKFYIEQTQAKIQKRNYCMEYIIIIKYTRIKKSNKYIFIFLGIKSKITISNYIWGREPQPLSTPTEVWYKVTSGSHTGLSLKETILLTIGSKPLFLTNQVRFWHFTPKN